MNSKFSDFFRLATPEEKERVWKEIARKSCEDQQEIINKANQMSALNEKKYNPITGFDEKSRLVQFLIKILLRLCSLLLGEKDVQFFYWKKNGSPHMQITPPEEKENFDSAKWYMRF